MWVACTDYSGAAGALDGSAEQVRQPRDDSRQQVKSETDRQGDDAGAHRAGAADLTTD